jgi:hypothetical protein
VPAEITMADGARYVTRDPTDAESLIKKFERRSFVAVELGDGTTVYINPLHVAVIRDV